MKANTIKIKKLFFNYLKEQAWLEQKALEGYKLCNITFGYIFEFEKIEPTRLVYEVERFNLSSHPTLREINERRQFLEMAEESGWELVTCDESLTYYLCKPYNEQDVNELYNDIESRKVRAGKFRNIYLEMSQTIMRFALAINLITILLFAMEGFQIQETFTRIYLAVALIYSSTSYIIYFIYKRLADNIYSELCMSKEDWQKKFDDTTKNVMKCTKLIVRSKSLVKYLNKQAMEGWYLSKANMFSYTFTREGNLIQSKVTAPSFGSQQTVYYVIENKSTLGRRLKNTGLSLEKNKKDIAGLGFEWLEQSVTIAKKEQLHYVCAYQKQYVVYAATDAAVAEHYQKKGVFVSWLSYGYAWFVLACMLLGGIGGFLAGMLA